MTQRIRRSPMPVRVCGLTATLVAVMVAAGPVAASPRPSAPGITTAVVREASGLERGRRVCGPPYVRNDRRLGPKNLPRTGRLARLLRGYVRFGGISPSRFLRRYWDRGAEPPGWRYPPDEGFAHSGGYVNGRLLRSRVRLAAGTRLDRFGGEFGSFLARRGTPFAGRALPPDSLNTRTDDPAHPCNYHVYRVARAFHVAAGPAVPAFQQAGMRRQYLLVSSYIPGAPVPVNVRWLVDNGYLRRVR